MVVDRAELKAPLDGYQVVELSSGIPGGYLGKLLADAGATVVKIEDRHGDPLRRWSASGTPIAAGDDGALFQFLATCKHSVVADLSSDEDVAVVGRLTSRADAVIWSAGSLVADDARFGPDALREASPATTVVALSAFGLDGPWADRPATEFTLQAWSGAMGLRGLSDRPPVSVGGRHGEWVTGVHAAVGLLASRWRTLTTGEGELLDVSMLEALAMTDQQQPMTSLSIAGGPALRRRFNPIPSVEPTADGWVAFMLVTGQQWLDFCVLIDRPDWLEDRSLGLQQHRLRRRSELIEAIRAWTITRTTDEIVELATLFRIPVAPVGNAATIPEMDHFVARGMFVRNPRSGFVQPDVPYVSDGLPRRSLAPAPRLGEHTDHHRSASAVAHHARRSSSSPQDALARPLAGIRVADFTAFWAGPFITHALAMLGADVIHVESAQRPDGFRMTSMRSFDEDYWWEYAPFFQGTNTCKRDVTLDMSSETGRALAGQLIAHCDVVVENYTPRVMENWGLGYEEVRALRPDVIMLRAPAFGLAGPWRDRSGYAVTMEAISGMTWLTGFPDGDPVAPSNPLDPIAGLHGAMALLLAIEQRRRTGVGMLIESPMIGAGLNVMAEQVVEFSHTGALLERMGNHGPTATPQNLYRSSDTDEAGRQDRWVAIAVENDEQWSGLCAALGDPPWSDDPRLATSSGRRALESLVDDGLRSWCEQRSSEQIVDALWAPGVPVGVVLLPHELGRVEQFAARQFFETLVHPVTGPTMYSGSPVRFSAGPHIKNVTPAPTLGQHNVDVLGGLIGLDAATIDQLEVDGVIGTRPGR